MENYKKTLKKRTQIYGALCGLVPVCLLAVNWLSNNALSPLNDHDMGFVHGLASGFTLLVIAFTVYTFARINMALKDESLLKKMYIAETDERRVFIQNKVGSNGMQLAVYLLVLSSVVACYFNIVVTYALVGAALGLALIMLGFKLYYRNKY